MSLDYGKEKCAICGAYLFEDDDVAHCPECGAPHHRECYLSLGHCGLAEFHGTENQYKKPESTTQKEPEAEDVVFCGRCGEKYKKDAPACPKCNTPNMLSMGSRAFTIDLMGGVPEDTDLGNGVTAKEAKQFVAGNTHRYLPKFLKFKYGKKASWNWLAFLTPCGWLLSRKMYILGAIIGAIQVALTMLSIPFTVAVNQLDLSETKGYFQVANIIRENISTIGVPVIVLALVGGLLAILLSVLFGVFGDYIYRNKVISNVSEIKKSDLDQELAFRKKGGVNFFIGVLGYFLVGELPTILAYTLGMFS
ncbi:MAG: DUF2628 domain-containing protein [Clostridia bacterium]|nr:DUF2628 domain-containing protein [Clostridia bacterium]